jgi:mono/diheme cytochrome c family protein
MSLGCSKPDRGAELPCDRAALERGDSVCRKLLESAAARQRGRELFLKHCALCHGERADGRGLRREGLTGLPVDFTSSAWATTATPARVFGVITDGKPGTSMPSWAPLDAGDRLDLTAYVLSVARPETR